MGLPVQRQHLGPQRLVACQPHVLWWQSLLQAAGSHATTGLDAALHVLQPPIRGNVSTAATPSCSSRRCPSAVWTQSTCTPGAAPARWQLGGTSPAATCCTSQASQAHRASCFNLPNSGRISPPCRQDGAGYQWHSSYWYWRYRVTFANGTNLFDFVWPTYSDAGYIWVAPARRSPPPPPVASPPPISQAQITTCKSRRVPAAPSHAEQGFAAQKGGPERLLSVPVLWLVPN
jgi:hypothetical protein